MNALFHDRTSICLDSRQQKIQADVHQILHLESPLLRRRASLAPRPCVRCRSLDSSPPSSDQQPLVRLLLGRQHRSRVPRRGRATVAPSCSPARRAKVLLTSIELVALLLMRVEALLVLLLLLLGVERLLLMRLLLLLGL